MPQPDMQQIMRQAQKLQADMARAQEALKHETVHASAGGGAVSVEVTGELVVKSITIAPEAVDPDDVEMLADMVLAAINQGLQAAQDLAQQRLSEATGGLTGPGGLGGLGLPGF
ncbi:MAG: YbaB/EbfC family nucleoid-associated protein [Solirubrobacteraceae bacterium]